MAIVPVIIGPCSIVFPTAHRRMKVLGAVVSFHLIGTQLAWLPDCPLMEIYAHCYMKRKSWQIAVAQSAKSQYYNIPVLDLLSAMDGTAYCRQNR